MGLIGYTTGIPNGPDNPSNDQPDMKINNDNIAKYVAVDHFPFNANKSGTHKQVTLTSESPPGIGNGTGVLFANTYNGDSWPFWQNTATGGTPMLLTGGVSVETAIGTAYLPGSIIIKWGSVTSGAPTGNVSFAPAFLNNCWNVQATPYYTGAPLPSGNATASIRSDSLTQTGFTWAANASGSGYTGFFWFAIGN